MAILTRRQFAAAGTATLTHAATQLPNILWLTCEDTGPHLGAYGDPEANTPNLDALAARSLLYRNAWSNAPVCAPARTTIISGLYPPSTGSEHMRSMTRLPRSMRMYPQFLREAGYYVTNNSKEDYNLEKPGSVWDDSSEKGHWRNRRLNQPFFAIFNFLITHESQIRRRPHKLVHDPSRLRIPAYHPDTPEVRHDWAQYYDNITTMDGQAGQLLGQLETDGLADDTIIFFYGDHGSGMPRSKRWPYNSGLQVPLLVHIPSKFRNLAPRDYRAGGKTDRLVSFVDLAPTLLSVAGIRPPSWMQGHAFLGQYQAPEQPYVYGFRGRMDERYDMVRSVRDKRYVYVRNYMPHQIYGQHVAYMFETPTTRVWKEQYDQGRLKPPQTYFWERKAPEELYDLQTDPDETKNLADSAAHRPALERMRKAQRDLALRIRDVGFLPEDEIHARSEGSSPYEMGHDDKLYPLQRILAAAEMATALRPESAKPVAALLSDKDSAVRYWGAMGLLMRGEPAVREAAGALQKALADSALAVRVAAGEALGRFGNAEETASAIATLVELADCEKNPYFIAVRALNALDALDERARPALDRIRALPRKPPKPDPRTSAYIGDLIAKIEKDLS